MVIPLIPRAIHGGPQTAGEKILDFSVNTNPLGPNNQLLKVWHEAAVSNYPDPHYTAARKSLGAAQNYPAEGVVLGVGASELLHRIVRAFVQPGDQVISLGAPFGEFERAVALQQAFLDVADRSLDAAKTALQDPKTRLVYLSNPHNPTAHFLDLSSLFSTDSPALSSDSSIPRALLVADEAYLPFLPDPIDWPPHPRLIRVRSPGKVHGLLGLRMAYALAHPSMATHLLNLQPSWCIPSPLAAVLEELSDQNQFVYETLALVRGWAKELAVALNASPRGIHFFTVDVPNATETAGDLARYNIRVRDCTSFGLPQQIRIATRIPAENEILVQVWRKLYG